MLRQNQTAVMSMEWYFQSCALFFMASTNRSTTSKQFEKKKCSTEKKIYEKGLQIDKNKINLINLQNCNASNDIITEQNKTTQTQLIKYKTKINFKKRKNIKIIVNKKIIIYKI